MISSQRKISSSVFKEKQIKKQKKKTKHFLFSFVFSSKKELTKYAVIINKKTVKKATKRNKNKRIIYNIISQTYPQFLYLKYVFIYIQEDISKIPYKELEEELKKFLFLIKKK